MPAETAEAEEEAKSAAADAEAAKRAAKKSKRMMVPQKSKTKQPPSFYGLCFKTTKVFKNPAALVGFFIDETFYELGLFWLSLVASSYAISHNMMATSKSLNEHRPSKETGIFLSASFA